MPTWPILVGGQEPVVPVWWPLVPARILLWLLRLLQLRWPARLLRLLRLRWPARLLRLLRLRWPARLLRLC